MYQLYIIFTYNVSGEWGDYKTDSYAYLYVQLEFYLLVQLNVIYGTNLTDTPLIIDKSMDVVG